VLVVPHAYLIGIISLGSLALLAALGAVAARAGGAGMIAGAWRVLVWGTFALAVTAGVGALFGAVA
jgi:VIT1/CCC1 family predicted Fe2+/Mn2+ transporter